MILLTSTSDLLQVVTASGVSAINVQASFVDLIGTVLTPGRQKVAGTILFSVDGGTETSISTDVPTVGLDVFIQLISRTGIRDMFIDFISYSATTGRT